MEAFAKSGGAPKREKMSKQERRALQEAQRVAKETGAPAPASVPAAAATAVATTSAAPAVAKPAKKGAEPVASSSGVRLQYDDTKRMAKRSKDVVVVRTQAQKQVAWFSHLPQYERESSLSLNVGFATKGEMHPAILALGLKFAEGKIVGGNARTVAMLTAFQQVIADYTTPPDKMLSRDLDKSLKPLIQYLIDCRPHCVGMGNAIRRLRNVIGTLSPELSEAEAKREILDEIDEYIQSRILLAMTAVAKIAQSKLMDGDVVLTYARSNVVEMILKETLEQRKHINLRVIVVDSRPHYEGKRMVKTLADMGIQATYIQINALSYIMRDVTKVLLGASAFMSNGTAVGRVGTALVAMCAREANVPVLFCCETYKFSDRVQLDAITHNELRDPDDLISSFATEKSHFAHGRGPHVLSDWRDIAQLKLLNLVYDVTPIEYVSMVVTELGMIPPTSIPAILREYSKDGVADPIN
jgi:translation initiation factor eIF-2B subunit delta